MKRLIATGAASLLCASLAHAAPVMMSGEWAQGMCQAWNSEPVLTDKLVESGWVKNDKGRGFKAMQIYRADCNGSPRIELRVSEKDGKAICVYGGKAESKLDSAADYLMWAETARWQEMGKGEYGPMRAMFFQRLRFDGPMGEAMGNMGPFESFLLLVGKVPGDTASCPGK
ncbi:MAG: SCP2 sterol-binding domain-containing protein [Betaproteobacteria bacterium]|nr:SCP2 sterol-binding domain-containing protein [Betaproteobacteria bacterium]